MSIAHVQLEILAQGYVIGAMQVISETRISRLNMLITQHGGSLANLNVALGLDRTDATLSQIRTRAPHSKTGKPRSMGDELARKIEERLHLAAGWMDTPITYAELHGEFDPRQKVMQLLENMPPDMWPTAVRVLDALTKQPGNGTNG